MSAAAPDAIGDLAASLGYDTEAILRFVTDEIRYEPYSGILRGARGTLASRAGNSADQALLLGGLLEASLVTFRFAVGKLDDANATAILASGTASVEEDRGRLLDAFMEPAGIAAPSVPRALTSDEQAALDRALAASSSVVDWARTHLDDSVRMIESTLAEAGVALPGGFSRLPDREIDEHVWVQVDSGTDWLDLDPTWPGSEGLVPPQADGTSDALPESLAHRVEFAVIGEAISGGALTETSLLRLSERADVLAGQPIMFLNVRPEGLRALGLNAALGLTGRKSYVPALVVGDAAYVGGIPIMFSAGGGDEGSPEDLFGGEGSDGEATAEWLDLTVTSPDSDTVVVRRAVFDRIGIEARSAGTFEPAALPQVELVSMGDLQDEVLEAQTTHWLTVSGSMPDRDAPVFHPAADDPAALALMAGAHHLLQELGAIELALPKGIRPFANGPNVTSFTYETVPGAQAPDVAVDIWHRASGLAPVSDRSAASNPMIVAGCLSHVAERLLLGEAEQSETPAAVSVGRLFEQAGRSGIASVLVTGAGAERGLPYPEHAKLRLGHRLAEGWLAIVPDRPVVLAGVERTGWWLIDPGSGRTVDEMDDGRGEAVDQLAQTMVAINARPALQALTVCFLQMAFAGMFLVEAAMSGSLAASAPSKDQAAALAIGLLASVLAGVTFGTVALVCF